MKNRDKAILVDGLKYIKYSYVASLITTLLPIVILPLIIVGIFSSMLMATLIGFISIFFGVMKLTQLIFLYNGFKSLNTIETEGLKSKTKKAYTFTATYVFILIGGWLLTKFMDSILIVQIHDYLTSLFLLIISYLTLQVLEDENVLGPKDKWLNYYVLALMLLETANFLGIQFIGSGITYQFNNLTYEAASILSIVTSIFILLKVNTYFKQVNEM